MVFNERIAEIDLFDDSGFDYRAEEEFITKQLITYIGNKRSLLKFIGQGVEYAQSRLRKKELVILDGFSGSGVVSRYLKRYAHILHTNDLETYCFHLNSCFLSNISKIDIKELSEIIEWLNTKKLETGFERGVIEELYAPANDENILKGERVFYTNRNAKIIDNIRRLIDTVPQHLKHYCISALLIKASVHTNTSGVFKGFYKNSKTGRGKFGGNAQNCLARIKKEIKIDVPIFSGHECKVQIWQKDINELVTELKDLDIVYYDPPYNQHPYGSNYFMLNTISDYKRPTIISKVSGIPKDWNKSTYNTKKEASDSFDALIRDTQSKFILISYNNEGIIPTVEMIPLLQKYGKITLFEQKYSTFKACRNLKNRNLKVKELLYIVEK